MRPTTRPAAGARKVSVRNAAVMPGSEISSRIGLTTTRAALTASTTFGGGSVAVSSLIAA